MEVSVSNISPADHGVGSDAMSVSSPAQSAKSSAQEIFETLAFRISRSLIPMGERLTENKLSRKFGVSRTPVREALRLLEQAGYVEKILPRGYVVRALDLEKVDQIYTVRIALEVLAIELAAAATNTPDFARLKEAVQESVNLASAENSKPRGVGSEGEELQLRESFHERLAALSGNEQLLRMLRDIDAQIYACRRLDSAVPERARAAQAEHLEILNLLEQGKITDACRAMRDHIENSQSIVRTLMRAGVTTISFGSATEGSRA